MPKVLAISAEPDLVEAHMLAGVARQGYEVLCLLSANARHKDILLNAKVRCAELEIRSRFDWRAIKSLRKLLRLEQPNIVHCFTNRALTTAIFALRGMPHIKLVAYRGTMGHLSRFSALSWLSYLNPRVDYIVCVSDAVRNFLATLVPTEKLTRIYKGHDPSWYIQSPRTPRNTLGVGDSDFVIACVANLRPVKGVAYLLDAMRQLDCPNAKLLLIGRLSEQEKVGIERDPKLQSKVKVLGFRADATCIVATCDVVVVPSISREGLPKSLLEAMSLGVAPVATNVGGIPEVIRDCDNGLLVPPRDGPAIRDALRLLATDIPLRGALGISAQETIRTKFNIECSIAELKALYQRLVQAPL